MIPLQGGRPFIYHVHYSIGGDRGGETFFIYSGYRDVVPFVLPAGLSSFNKKGMHCMQGLNVSDQLVAYATRFFILRLKNHM